MTDFVDARDFAEAMIRFRVKKERQERLVRPRKKRASKYNYEDIKAMRESGALTAEIAEKYGVTVTKMKNYMSKHGIRLPKEILAERNRQNGGAKLNSGRPRKFDRQQVLEMRNSGMKSKDIAAQLGVTESSIYHVLTHARKEEKEAVV